MSDLIIDGEDFDPRYRIRPHVADEAAEEYNAVKIDPALADHHGLKVDAQGFPTRDSLEAWHRKHNPHLFKGG